MTRSRKAGLVIAAIVSGVVWYRTDRILQVVVDPQLAPFRGETSVQVWCEGALSFAINTPRMALTYATYRYYDNLPRQSGIDGRG